KRSLLKIPHLSMKDFLRRERDSNPRYSYPVYRLSRSAHSTTLTPLLLRKRRYDFPAILENKKQKSRSDDRLFYTVQNITLLHAVMLVYKLLFSLVYDELQI